MARELSLKDLSHQDVPGSLKLISDDIEADPDRLRPLDADLVQRLGSLVKGVEIDVDLPLCNEDEKTVS